MKRNIQYCAVLFFAGLLSLVPLYAQTDIFYEDWSGDYRVWLKIKNGGTIYQNGSNVYFSGDTAALDFRTEEHSDSGETLSAQFRIYVKAGNHFKSILI